MNITKLMSVKPWDIKILVLIGIQAQWMGSGLLEKSSRVPEMGDQVMKIFQVIYSGDRIKNVKAVKAIANELACPASPER